MNLNFKSRKSVITRYFAQFCIKKGLKGCYSFKAFLYNENPTLGVGFHGAKGGE